MTAIVSPVHISAPSLPDRNGTHHRSPWISRRIRSTPGSLLIFIFLLLLPQIAGATELTGPEIHAGVTIQAEFFGDGLPLLTSFGPHIDRYVVRHAAIGISGELGDRVEYDMEVGTATCVGGGQLRLMEGGVYYRITPQVRLGVAQGHVMRGFDLHQECVGLLTAEKPLWAFAVSPCHPAGVVCDFDFRTGDHAGIEGQLAYLNGAGETLDDEHDANIGLTFHTPLPGLSVSSFYNHVELDLGYSDDWKLLHGTGYRAGLGVDYQTDAIFLRGEYYTGRGFRRGVGVGEVEIPIDPEDHEMMAYYVEGAYTISTGFDPLPSVQPYVRYQVWDRGSNDPEDLEFTYITAGVTVRLGEGVCSLRAEYEAPLATPEDEDKEASRFVIRLQAEN